MFSAAGTAPSVVSALDGIATGGGRDTTVNAAAQGHTPDAAPGDGTRPTGSHSPGASDASGKAHRHPSDAATASTDPREAAAAGTARTGRTRTGAGRARGDMRAADASWVHTWAAAQQLTEPANMPPAPFNQNGVVLADSTLRQTVHVTLGGAQLRLHLSNVFGGAPLPITSVSVALPRDGKAGTDAIEAGTSRKVTFLDQASVTVPTGAEAVSDPLDFTVRPDSDLTVTVYLASGQASQNITSHPGSRTTSYLLAGDHTEDATLPGATTAEHWYFISGIEVPSDGAQQATAVLGDSLTDGRGSTTNGNDRWPDQLRNRLAADPGTAQTAVLNKGLGGGRVLADGLGPSALSRFDRDVLGPSGVTSVIVFEGINDIGTAAATKDAQQAVADNLIAAYDQMITKAHARGLKVYGATLTPFQGNAYADAGGLRDAARGTVNDWIRTSGHFDAVIDLDQAARDPQQPNRLNPAYDTGDHLHMNPSGYAALAGAVPLKLFS